MSRMAAGLRAQSLTTGLQLANTGEPHRRKKSIATSCILALGRDNTTLQGLWHSNSAP